MQLLLLPLLLRKKHRLTLFTHEISNEFLFTLIRELNNDTVFKLLGNFPLDLGEFTQTLPLVDCRDLIQRRRNNDRS